MNYFSRILAGDYSFFVLIFRDYLLIGNVLGAVIFAPFCSFLFPFIAPQYFIVFVSMYKILVLLGVWVRASSLQRWKALLIQLPLLIILLSESLVFFIVLSAIVDPNAQDTWKRLLRIPHAS